MIIHGWAVKVVAGVGEENNWCLVRFKGWFRYMSGRLYSEDKRV